ncbi:hypothetical protein HDU76_012464 [Blyttiomyces sp. JEL0837]|nr:hypothetical protein HDU76_012464 [Blyttiomyces sp. JEL0837]
MESINSSSNIKPPDEQELPSDTNRSRHQIENFVSGLPISALLNNDDFVEERQVPTFSSSSSLQGFPAPVSSTDQTASQTTQMVNEAFRAKAGSLDFEGLLQSDSMATLGRESVNQSRFDFSSSSDTDLVDSKTLTATAPNEQQDDDVELEEVVEEGSPLFKFAILGEKQTVPSFLNKAPGVRTDSETKKKNPPAGNNGQVTATEAVQSSKRTQNSSRSGTALESSSVRDAVPKQSSTGGSSFNFGGMAQASWQSSLELEDTPRFDIGTNFNVAPFTTTTNQKGAADANHEDVVGTETAPFSFDTRHEHKTPPFLNKTLLPEIHVEKNKPAANNSGVNALEAFEGSARTKRAAEIASFTGSTSLPDGTSQVGSSALDFGKYAQRITDFKSEFKVAENVLDQPQKPEILNRGPLSLGSFMGGNSNSADDISTVTSLVQTAIQQLGQGHAGTQHVGSVEAKVSNSGPPPLFFGRFPSEVNNTVDKKLSTPTEHANSSESTVNRTDLSMNSVKGSHAEKLPSLPAFGITAERDLQGTSRLSHPARRHDDIGIDHARIDWEASSTTEPNDWMDEFDVVESTTGLLTFNIANDDAGQFGVRAGEVAPRNNNDDVDHPIEFNRGSLNVMPAARAPGISLSGNHEKSVFDSDDEACEFVHKTTRPNPVSTVAAGLDLPKLNFASSHPGAGNSTTLNQFRSDSIGDLSSPPNMGNTNTNEGLAASPESAEAESSLLREPNFESMSVADPKMQKGLAIVKPRRRRAPAATIVLPQRQPPTLPWLLEARSSTEECDSDTGSEGSGRAPANANTKRRRSTFGESRRKMAAPMSKTEDEAETTNIDAAPQKSLAQRALERKRERILPGTNALSNVEIQDGFVAAFAGFCALMPVRQDVQNSSDVHCNTFEDKVTVTDLSRRNTAEVGGHGGLDAYECQRWDPFCSSTSWKSRHLQQTTLPEETGSDFYVNPLYTEAGNVLAACNEADTFIGAAGRGNDRTEYLSLRPVSHVKDLRVVQVCAGLYHSMVLTEEGNVFGWGAKDLYQTAFSLTKFAERYPRLAKVVAIQEKWRNADAASAMAMAASDRPTVDCTAFPFQVTGLDDVEVRELACGDCCSFALSKFGNVYGCGAFIGLLDPSITGFKTIDLSPASTHFTQVLGLKRIERIWCRFNTMVARRDKKRLFSMGRPEHGQLGRAVQGLDCLEPQEVKIAQLGLGDIVDVAIGETHTVVLGEIKVGVYLDKVETFNSHNYDAPDVYTPTFSHTFIKGSAGERHTTCIDSLGRAYCFGDNYEAQHAQGSIVCNKVTDHTPKYIPGLDNVKEIISGSRFSVALTNESRDNVKIWGMTNLAEALKFPGDPEPDEVVTSPMRCCLKGARAIQIAAGSSYNSHLLVLADPTTIANFKKSGATGNDTKMECLEGNHIEDREESKEKLQDEEGFKSKWKSFCERTRSQWKNACQRTKTSLNQVKAKFLSRLCPKRAGGSN